MLPSFRLVAATFFCAFLVVFAGLRLAASLHDIHEGAPVIVAHAAPMSITPAADRDMRRGLSAVPVMYDMRFVANPMLPTLAAIAPPDLVDRTASTTAAAPMDEAPSEAVAAATEHAIAVAATQPEAPDTPTIVA